MNTKLTLTIEKEVIEIAKQYAKEKRTKSIWNGRELLQVCNCKEGLNSKKSNSHQELDDLEELLKQMIILTTNKF